MKSYYREVSGKIKATLPWCTCHKCIRGVSLALWLLLPSEVPKTVMNMHRYLADTFIFLTVLRNAPGDVDDSAMCIAQTVVWM